MVELPVLVLNQNYEPLNICRVRRALVLMFNGKAEALENGRGELTCSMGVYHIPSVVRLIYMVKRPRLRRRATRTEIFSRDRYTCQYCGKETRDLTLDHVVPRRRGGEHKWENVVSACAACNHRKAGRTPTEAGMRLRQQPYAPRDSDFFVPYHYLRAHGEWQKYVPISGNNMPEGGKPAA
ncbi:MAG: HNH endonuclease [Chloroflexi bacterium]|nr:HNH endonuclease [Chloroflexota bacterium]